MPIKILLYLCLGQSIAHKVLALHAANMCLIPNTPYKACTQPFELSLCLKGLTQESKEKH